MFDDEEKIQWEALFSVADLAEFVRAVSAAQPEWLEQVSLAIPDDESADVVVAFRLAGRGAPATLPIETIAPIWYEHDAGEAVCAILSALRRLLP